MVHYMDSLDGSVVLALLVLLFALVILIVAASMLTQPGRWSRRSAPADGGGGPWASPSVDQDMLLAIDRLADVLRHERSEAINAAMDSMLSVASSKLGDQLETGRQVIGREAESVTVQVQNVSNELHRMTGLVAELQKERAQQAGVFASGLQQAARVTEALNQTTQSLRQALASPQARGQWGERLAEDVLRAAGFVEGINYQRQQKLPGGGVPDYTFSLPKGHGVHMDVKFPLDNYLRWLEADDEATRALRAKDFQRDVRQRIKELGARAYIDPATTVDYLILFVPNESVYGFVHEHDPEVLDFALGQKVVLCSPTTLFAVLAVIRQAVDNFLVERRSDDILAAMGGLREQWDLLFDQFDKMQRALTTAQKAFDEVAGKRGRQFARQLEKLEEVRDTRQGDLAAPIDREQAPADPQPLPIFGMVRGQS